VTRVNGPVATGSSLAKAVGSGTVDQMCSGTIGCSAMLSSTGTWRLFSSMSTV
jgi:hypothetical protein